MVAYKLSKNGWVLPFFVIFRLAGEKLLVTVALDHPVALLVLLVTNITSGKIVEVAQVSITNEGIIH